MKKLTLDEKIDCILSKGFSFPYLEYYSHTNCTMYKMENYNTKYRKEIQVISPKEGGFEHAIDMAISIIKEIKEKEGKI